MGQTRPWVVNARTCFYPVYVCSLCLRVCELLHARWCCVLWERNHENYGRSGIACTGVWCMYLLFFASQLRMSCKASIVQFKRR